MEGDAWQTMTVDSIYIFLSNYLLPISLGWNVQVDSDPVHEKIVTRQLHTMFHVVQQCVSSMSLFATNEMLLVDGTGPMLVDAP